MKKIFAILLIFTIAISCKHLQGSGNIITEKREVGSFEGIDVGGAFEVELQQGPVQSVTVETDDNLIKEINTKVNGGVLKISTRDHLNISDGHYKVYVVSPVIKSMDCSGAASVKTKGVLKNAVEIEIETSGAANLTAELDAPTVKVTASGAGTVKLSGRTKAYKAVSSGSADVKTINLLSENAEVAVSGAGNIHVHASVTLKAEASGAGAIYYTGAARVDQSVTGAGSIRREE